MTEISTERLLNQLDVLKATRKAGEGKLSYALLYQLDDQIRQLNDTIEARKRADMRAMRGF